MKNRKNFYHRQLEFYYGFMIPQGSVVVELGCGEGDLLAAVKPSKGLGVDCDSEKIAKAREKFPGIEFQVSDAEEFVCGFQPEYIIVSDLLTCLVDVQKFFHTVRKYCGRETKIIISSYSYTWEPVLKLAEFLHIKPKQKLQNWLSAADINNILHLEDFETVKSGKKLLLPVYVPLLNFFANKIFANIPPFSGGGLVRFMTVRAVEKDEKEYSVSIVVPARNEEGNIENAVLRTPQFSKHQEFIFIEGHSEDKTYEECLRVKEKYPEKDIKVMRQTGKGKGNAVREAFAAAQGDILIILDADLTTPPEDLPKFYEALRSGKCDFVNGCRLVYQMEKQAMRFLNLIANKLFGKFFSYLLGQRLKDTLCGTKVLFKKDYGKIAANRAYFGDFDPFGDFDLLFGASKLNLKISEVIVRYRDRQYGSTQIKRFSHGWLLIKMSLFAAKKIKFV